MNPIFDPGTSGAPQFVPGTNPQLFSAMDASTGGGDPGTVGGGPGQATNTSTAGGSGVPAADQQHLASPGGVSTRPAPTGGQAAFGMPSWWHQPAAMAPTGPTASNRAAMAAWDPAAHPGRRAPTMPGWTNPNHQGAIGYDWSRYNQGGNLGMSAPGSRSPTGNPAFTSADPNYEYKPWMADTSVQWGGGPHGYLPIGYQGQDFSYYQNAQNLAPWEQQYMQDTWTQNFDPNSPTGGYINTRHG